MQQKHYISLQYAHIKTTQTTGFQQFKTQQNTLHIHRFTFYISESCITNINLYTVLHTLFEVFTQLLVLRFAIAFVYDWNNALQNRMQRKTNTKSRFDEKFDFEAFCAFSHSLY